MNHKSSNSSSTNDVARCQHRTRSGRHCRLAVSDTTSGFCTKHSRAHQKQCETADLAAVLTADISEFKCAGEVHDFLSRLLMLLAQKRISPRHAGVMAYISSLHLRTLTAINRETGEEPVTIIFDGPHPIRDDPPQPSCPNPHD
jgi:hypothetical protein